MLANRNRGRNIAAQAGLAALGVGARLAGSYVRGMVNGATAGAVSAGVARGKRYFQGDVNQPATARTVQSLAVSRSRPSRQRRMGRGGASHTEAGSTKLFDITTSATAGENTVGKAVVSYQMTLETIGGRLGVIAQLYARWKFVRAVLRYVPSVSSATDGGLVMYYTQEPDDTYVPGEAVGTTNASSALDNLEFSVREKASQVLHLPSQLLYTTPSSEVAWHSAGVINVVSGGSLATSKTYGAVYLDFAIELLQPTAPFNSYSPVMDNVGAGITPAGTGANGPGILNGPIFDWSNDKAKLTPDFGDSWLLDPSTHAVNQSGKFYLPPLSTVAFSLTAADSAAINGTLSWTLDAGVTNVFSYSQMSTDKTLKNFTGIVTNSNPYRAGFKLIALAAGFALNSAKLVLTQVPYRV